MTEYIGREEKCGDCIHVEVCERNPILTEFSRENPAYCKKFMKAADISPVRHGRWTETRTMDKIRDYLSDAEIPRPARRGSIRTGTGCVEAAACA